MADDDHAEQDDSDRADEHPEPSVSDQLGSAVDEAMQAELKRQFVARIVGMDRGEGVGRREAYWDDGIYRRFGLEDPDDDAR